MSINKIEIQDGSGNVYYPKTSIDSVIYNDNTSIEEKIIILERKLNELKSQLANSINNLQLISLKFVWEKEIHVIIGLQKLILILGMHFKKGVII